MSTPAAKRRKIEASNTLSKPFRSPFKTPFKSPVPAQDASTTLETSTPSTNRTLASIKTPKLPSPATNARSRQLKRNFLSPAQTVALNGDPDIAPLLKLQRELEKQLREMKEELETAEQARKIERESAKRNDNGEIDGELVELVGKWRVASRQAAEELFDKVRDRVNRMGGPRAWKEMQKMQLEFQGGWDNNDEQTGGNGEDDEDERKGEVENRGLYAEYGIDAETENEKSQRADLVGDIEEIPSQEDEFTMAMMLKTLNVELATIGYDLEAQIWTD